MLASVKTFAAQCTTPQFTKKKVTNFNHCSRFCKGYVNNKFTNIWHCWEFNILWSYQHKIMLDPHVLHYDTTTISGCKVEGILNWIKSKTTVGINKKFCGTAVLVLRWWYFAASNILLVYASVAECFPVIWPSAQIHLVDVSNSI